MDSRRFKIIQSGTTNHKNVVYWMSRDQRIDDNWAFLHAQNTAMDQSGVFFVVFCLMPSFPGATYRHYSFMIEGLEEVEKRCHELNVPFELLQGEASETLPSFLIDNDIGTLVCDMSPLRLHKQWISDIKAKAENCNIVQMDAHNIVPVWEASPKQETAARTIRPKIENLIPQFLTEFPEPIVQQKQKETTNIDWQSILANFVKAVPTDQTSNHPLKIRGGYTAGIEAVKSFSEDPRRLQKFAENRNDPNAPEAQSGLSPYLHFGHIASQKAVWIATKGRKWGGNMSVSIKAFLEEIIVRKELSDNFCWYNEKYDSIQGAATWAQQTLDDHRGDKRIYIYSRSVLENAKTHDKLWNAAQRQMVTEGKLHGFLRMYWAKKFLEWTSSPEDALAYALYLNDKYNLDGRDPNGIVGCMWSICGTHDQGWAERKIFGKIRYMNYEGCQRKFDVKKFEAKYSTDQMHIKRERMDAKDNQSKKMKNETSS